MLIANSIGSIEDARGFMASTRDLLEAFLGSYRIMNWTFYKF